MQRNNLFKTWLEKQSEYKLTARARTHTHTHTMQYKYIKEFITLILVHPRYENIYYTSTNVKILDPVNILQYILKKTSDFFSQLTNIIQKYILYLYFAAQMKFINMS